MIIALWHREREWLFEVPGGAKMAARFYLGFPLKYQKGATIGETPGLPFLPEGC